MSNVIPFRRRTFEVTIPIATEVLYKDDRIMLVRTQVLGATTHFLAHRASERIEITPVDA